MQDDVSSLLGRILTIETLIRVGCTGVGFITSCVIRLADQRRRCLHLVPERARQTFRRQARRLVIRAFLAGRHPGLWFRLVYILQRNSVQYEMSKVMMLRNTAEPAFAMPLAEATVDSLNCDDDDVYLPAVAALARELQVWERFSAHVPDDMLPLRCLVAERSAELAKYVQAIYERLMSQHAELALDELQRSPKVVADYLERVIRQESKSVRGRLGCLGRKLLEMLDESREGIQLLVRARQSRTDDLTSAAASPTGPFHPGQEHIPLTSQLPMWLRAALVFVVLAVLMLIGLEVAQMLRR